MTSLEIRQRRERLINNLLFDEEVILLAGTIQECAVGYGNTLVYGNCLGDFEWNGVAFPYQNFTKAYGLPHSVCTDSILRANDFENPGETPRERAIRMGYFLQRLWKEED